MATEPYYSQSEAKFGARMVVEHSDLQGNHDSRYVLARRRAA